MGATGSAEQQQRAERDVGAGRKREDGRRHEEEWRRGQAVLYDSATHRAWIEATVLRAHSDGTVTLDVRERADPRRIRPADAGRRRRTEGGVQPSSASALEGVSREADALARAVKAVGAQRSATASELRSWARQCDELQERAQEHAERSERQQGLEATLAALATALAAELAEAEAPQPRRRKPPARRRLAAPEPEPEPERGPEPEQEPELACRLLSDDGAATNRRPSAIVALMQAHPHSAEVQRRGCFRLQQLADIADHRAPIVQSGGDIAVLAALMAFGDDAIQRMGMCVLETLALAPTARAAMAAHIDEACSRRPPPRGDLEEDQEEQEELEADLRRSFGSDASEPGDRPSPPVSIDKHSRRSGAWREEQDEESAVGSGGFAVAEQRRAMWGRTDLHVGSAGGRDEEPSAF